MDTRTTWTALGIAGALTTAALAIPGVSVARDDAPADLATEDAPAPWSRRAERHQAFIDALAEELGISAEELEDAIANVRADLREEHLARLRERLDERVAAGDLTREQADEILERAENGEWPFGRRPHRRPGHRPGFAPHGPFGDDDEAANAATNTA